MKKFYTLALAAASMLSAGALPTTVPQALNGSKIQELAASRLAKQRIGADRAIANQRLGLKDGNVLKSSVRFQAPANTDKYIDEQPEGTLTTMTQADGLSWGYNWFFGIYNQPNDGALVNKVVSPDGKKMYIYNIITQFQMKGWMEGDIEGDVVTFQLPQFINLDDENGYIYEDYVAKLEYSAEEQYFVLAADQTYKLKINADGSLTSLEDGNTLLGHVMKNDDADWAWQGNGEITGSFNVLDAKTVEVPASAAFEKWYMTDGVEATEMPVAFDGSKVYVKGLSDYEEIIDNAIVGDYDAAAGKVTFKSGQYLGENWTLGTTAYFMALDTIQVYDPDWDEYYTAYKFADQIVFDYDAENKILSSDGNYGLNTNTATVLTFGTIAQPVIKYQNPDFTVKALPTPIDDGFYQDPGSPAVFYFIFPMLDSEGNVLDTSKLFYNLIMDDEPFTFYNDQYIELPVEELTDVPYGFETYDEFYHYGTSHAVTVYTEGYENLGIQTIYKEGDKEIRSEILWAPGYTDVESVLGSKTVVAEAFYDLQGRRVAKPANGFFIRRATMSDGSVINSKVLRK